MNRSIVSVVVVATALAGAARAADPASTEPRASMHRVFEALVQLLPAGLDEERFADPARRKELRAWLEVLSNSTLELERHANSRDIGFRFLSRSLSADVAEIRFRFDQGRYEQARYFLVESTKNCVACHSRLPGARDFPLGERLTKRIDTDSLSMHERAQFAVATRRFDDALDHWEKLFADPMVSPAEMDIGGYLLDYLTTSIRVKGDAVRPQAALAELAKREDTPRYLKRLLAAWQGALAALEPEVKAPPTLERARRIAALADELDAFPAGREHLVHDLVASSILLRVIDSMERGPETDPAQAEAFYRLGLSEARSVDAYWVPQTEFHLEAAVRLDPGGPYARDAYALLEEYVILGYGGSSGVHLPADVWAKLEELQKLIDKS